MVLKMPVIDRVCMGWFEMVGIEAWVSEDIGKESCKFGDMSGRWDEDGIIVALGWIEDIGMVRSRFEVAADENGFGREVGQEALPRVLEGELECK